MEKSYFAILVRDFDNEEIYKNPETFDLNGLAEYTTRILFKSTNQNEAYNEYKSILKSIPYLKQRARKETGYKGEDDINMEFCLVRISPMSDWTSPEDSQDG